MLKIGDIVYLLVTQERSTGYIKSIDSESLSMRYKYTQYTVVQFGNGKVWLLGEHQLCSYEEGDKILWTTQMNCCTL